ncbi:MAG TPA: hypothetical protein VIG24_17615 [Acidimicrobiia bacterium]
MNDARPHDHLCATPKCKCGCGDPLTPDGSCDCPLILKVRSEERYASDENGGPYQDGYLVGRNVAALAIREYFHRIIEDESGNHYPGCWRSHVGCAVVLAADVAALEE